MMNTMKAMIMVPILMNDITLVLTVGMMVIEGGGIQGYLPNRYLREHRIMLCSGSAAVWRAMRGLKPKVGLRADLEERLLWNRALVWCLVGIDYEMLELGSDDLDMGSKLCPWSPTVALHVLLNLGIETALMCLDSLRLPNCARNPHVGSSISVDKVTKEKCFLITFHKLFS
ncbi:hypothetical protein M9H77_17379 [Catharanthus roseus]|uniref:Uncharacterized protein n=1 Tax=Catharanthus roseus TaxID=4058 RepID=A0ACC0B4F6_CATRO|nr:hypothetical protein M9H77_17379 [Catharanthus roseus]